MTTLICWVGVDQRGPASAYIASDSRISWDGATGWNHGQKVFASRTMPDMFGFCGDVVFASSVLSQAVSMIDAGVLYERDADAEARLRAVERLLGTGLDAYPKEYRRSFSVLYCHRSTEDRTPLGLHIGQVDWRPTSGWGRAWHEVPNASALVVALGSGGNKAKQWNDRWSASDVGGTSRAVFSAFCDHLRSGNDPRTGGAPQLVGVCRKGPARSVGVISEAGLTHLGLEVPQTKAANQIEWRNELFEVCDAQTGRRAKGAQPHARPATVG